MKSFKFENIIEDKKGGSPSNAKIIFLKLIKAYKSLFVFSTSNDIHDFERGHNPKFNKKVNNNKKIKSLLNFSLTLF